MVSKTTQSWTIYFFDYFFWGQPIIMNFCMDNLRTIEQLLGLISGRSPYRVKYGGQPKLNLIFEANALHTRLYHQVKHFWSCKLVKSVNLSNIFCGHPTLSYIMRRKLSTLRYILSFSGQKCSIVVWNRVRNASTINFQPPYQSIFPILPSKAVHPDGSIGILHVPIGRKR